MSKNIVKVNITRLKKALKDKLDNIDANLEKKVYDGFYESRLRIEMSMWKKGKAIASYFRGVNYEVISYAELSRQTGRSDMSLKKWHKLYEKYPNKRDYQRIAEEKAQSWTAKVFDKMNALADGETKQLLDEKMSKRQKEIITYRRDLEEHFRRSLWKLSLDELKEFRDMFNFFCIDWWYDVREYLHHRVCVRWGYDPDSESDDTFRMVSFRKREEEKVEVRQKIIRRLNKIKN